MPARQARLRVERGAEPGSYPLEPNRPFIVGRSREASLAIEAPGISRRHFELPWDGSVCSLRDLGSRNGVFVNGHQVSDAVLRHGDRIQAAQTTYLFEILSSRKRIVDEGAAGIRQSLPPAAAV